MNPLTTAETELASAKYNTWQHPEETERVYFEDLGVFGMVTTYPSVPALLEEWEDRQDQFLNRHADALRASENKEKVWNAYTVHLTIGDFNNDDKVRTIQENKLFQIEENFRGSRKVVRANVSTKKDVRDALLPLLSIQHRPQLAAEDYRSRLEKELGEDFPETFLEVLDQDTPIHDIVNELLEEQ